MGWGRQQYTLGLRAMALRRRSSSRPLTRRVPTCADLGASQCAPIGSEVGAEQRVNQHSGQSIW